MERLNWWIRRSLQALRLISIETNTSLISFLFLPWLILTFKIWKTCYQHYPRYLSDGGPASEKGIQAYWCPNAGNVGKVEVQISGIGLMLAFWLVSADIHTKVNKAMIPALDTQGCTNFKSISDVWAVWPTMGRCQADGQTNAGLRPAYCWGWF